MRRTPGGELQVLLITSRDTGRWVVPKGWRMKGLADNEAAAEEAFEEAGIRGSISAKPIGRYHYAKQDTESHRRLRVDVYAMEAVGELDEWPEQHERRRAWFAVEAAIELVREPRLREIIRQLSESPKTE